MYTNPANIIFTLIGLLDKNAQQINQVVRHYQGGSRKLMVLPGMRKVVPADAYPIMEIEPGSVPNQWATTRAQRPRYQFSCTITALVDNEAFGVEYICSLATVIGEIMTSPENLQMPILNESKWDLTGGLGQTYILDSLIENANYSAEKQGSIRKAEFNWFASVHEPYPESKWRLNSYSTPTVIKPIVFK
jgi:hypothetical protein